LLEIKGGKKEILSHGLQQETEKPGNLFEARSLQMMKIRKIYYR
jgi:hypothetical protein